MKKDKKPDTLAVIDNYNFYDRHTHIHTYGHGDSMTDPAQRPESVKSKQRKKRLVKNQKSSECEKRTRKYIKYKYNK